MTKTNFSLEGPEADGVITVGITYTTHAMADAIAMVELAAMLASGVQTPLDIFKAATDAQNAESNEFIPASEIEDAPSQPVLPFVNTAPSAPAAESAETTAKRRGRPPGSKNAPKPAAPSSAPASSADPEPAEVSEPEPPVVAAPPMVQKSPEVLAELKANIAAIEGKPALQQGPIDPPFGADDINEKMIAGCAKAFETFGGERPTFRNTLQYLYMTPGLPTTGNADAVKAWCLEYHDRVPALADSPDLVGRLDRAIALVCKGA